MVYYMGWVAAVHSHLMAHVIGRGVELHFIVAARLQSIYYELLLMTFCKVMHVGFGDQLTVTVWAIVAFYFKCFFFFFCLLCHELR